MKYYKEEILSKLNESGWELVQRDDDTDWWLEEVWEIKSVKQAWGSQLFIHFLVDLQYEGNNKSSAVWCVTARTERANDYQTAQENIADLMLQKGRFDQNIENFVLAINEHRNTKNT